MMKYNLIHSSLKLLIMTYKSLQTALTNMKYYPACIATARSSLVIAEGMTVVGWLE